MLGSGVIFDEQRIRIDRQRHLATTEVVISQSDTRAFRQPATGHSFLDPDEQFLGLFRGVNDSHAPHLSFESTGIQLGNLQLALKGFDEDFARGIDPGDVFVVEQGLVVVPTGAI